MAGAFGGAFAGGAAVNIVIRAVDEFSGTISKATSKFSSLGNLAGGAVKGMALLGTATLGVGTALGLMAKSAAQAADVQEQFNTIAGTQGTNLLNQLQKATLNTVNKFELMSIANSSL